MPTLGKEYQAKVINAGNVLVGVAQVRVGKPCDRPVGTAEVGVIQAVGKSALITDATDGVTQIVRPTKTANAGTLVASMPASAYTGTYDGTFIIRYVSATSLVVYGPNGYPTAITMVAGAATAQALKLNATDNSGITLTVAFTGAAEGDTWVLPVWSGSALSGRQTGIVSPYSPFKGSGNSVGGLKSATFAPKIDGVKLLESGFPEGIDDRIITKTSASVKFEALEFTGPTMQYLRDMVSQIVNESKLVAVPVEVVMRTRGNSLVSFWLPNMGMNSPPSYSPQNDYSTLPWELESFNLTEVSNETEGFETKSANELLVYNAWLRSSYVYYELGYIH